MYLYACHVHIFGQIHHRPLPLKYESQTTQQMTDWIKHRQINSDEVFDFWYITRYQVKLAENSLSTSKLQ